ncbi:MAG: hypothetical protein ACFFHD_13295, partial [Promethearchaeota archaeon]
MSFGDFVLAGWLDGLTCGAIITSTFIFGIISIVKGGRNRARLLVIAGIEVMAIGSYYLGPFVDFLYYGFTSTHIPIWLYPLLSYTQVVVGVIFIAVLGGELLMPNYKSEVIGMMSALGFMLFVYIYTGVYALAYEIPYFNSVAPLHPGYESIFEEIGNYAPWTAFVYYPPGPGELIDVAWAPWNPVVMLIWIFQGFNLIFMGGGFIVKSIQSTGG